MGVREREVFCVKHERRSERRCEAIGSGGEKRREDAGYIVPKAGPGGNEKTSAQEGTDVNLKNFRKYIDPVILSKGEEYAARLLEKYPRRPALRDELEAIGL